VVGGNYEELENYLRDIFVARGESVTQNSLFTKSSSKMFGQMKIMNIKGKEAEPLDIALFKCEKITMDEENNTDEEDSTDKNNNPDEEDNIDKKLKKKERYTFGWSYVQDAKSRDYTMNALYIQIFPEMYLIDPTGLGLDDIKNKTLVLAHEESFEHDLGGQLRFWKMIEKGEFKYHLDLPAKVNLFLVRYIRSMLADKTQLPIIQFFRKLKSKLFKNPLEMPEQINKIGSSVQKILGNYLPKPPIW